MDQTEFLHIVKKMAAYSKEKRQCIKEAVSLDYQREELSRGKRIRTDRIMILDEKIFEIQTRLHKLIYDQLPRSSDEE